MKILICAALFCAVFGTALGQAKPDWHGLYAQFSRDPNPGADGFFEIPRTSAEGDAKNWSLVPSVSEPNLTARCFNRDVRLCALYDKNGNIAAYQIAVDADEIASQNVPYNMTRYPLFEKRVYGGMNYWVTINYIVSQETISAGGRPSPIKETGDGLWFKTGQTVMNVPFVEKELASTTIFKKQNCADNMGTHYGYNSTVQGSCDDHYPLAPLVKNGQVVGVAFQLPGTHAKWGTPWFEFVPPQVIPFIYPLGPPCLPKIVEEFGLISIHVWFNAEPFKMTCTPDDNIVNFP